MLVIKNARILGKECVQDILIGDNGKYLEIRPQIDEKEIAGAEVIDAREMLAAPTFVNTHMHYDKAYTSLDEFVEWFPEQSKSDVELLHPYDYDSTLNRILTYSRKLSGR